MRLEYVGLVNGKNYAGNGLNTITALGVVPLKITSISPDAQPSLLRPNGTIERLTSAPGWSTIRRPPKSRSPFSAFSAVFAVLRLLFVIWTATFPRRIHISSGQQLNLKNLLACNVFSKVSSLGTGPRPIQTLHFQAIGSLQSGDVWYAKAAFQLIWIGFHMWQHRNGSTFGEKSPILLAHGLMKKRKVPRSLKMNGSNMMGARNQLQQIQKHERSK